MGAPQRCGREAEKRRAEAREQWSEGELLSRAEAREQRSEGELLSEAEAREQRSERQLRSRAEAREQRSEREILSMAAEGGHNQLSEKERTTVALTRILGSGLIRGKSLRLMEQLADCIQRPQAGVLQGEEPAKQVAAQQVTTVEEESVETEPAEVPTAGE